LRQDEKKPPLISIVTPTYNSSCYIKDTIESVQSQTCTNWEMIIVDDCSYDETIFIVKKEIEKDPRISLHQLERNSGAAVTRNVAITQASGKYIAFLDSDDLWHPKKLEKQLEFMKKNEYAFSFTSYRIMKEDGNLTEKVIHAPKQITYKQLLKNTIIGCLTVMIDIEKTGKMQMPNIRAGQDTAYWLSILKQGYIAYGLNEDLSIYRKVNGSISSNKLKAFRKMWVIYRRLELLNPIISTYYLSHFVWNALKKRK
jgi:teichuronic acid biosynthesis glycosyltransferase TuaG